MVCCRSPVEKNDFNVLKVMRVQFVWMALEQQSRGEKGETDIAPSTTTNTELSSFPSVNHNMFVNPEKIPD